MSKIVTFEQAKRLKKLDFNYLVRSYYDIEGSIYNNIPSDHNTLPRYDNGRYSAPTVSEALDFIREKRKVICAIDVDYFDGYYYTGKYKQRHLIKFSYTDSFDDHYNAESALLNAVLEYLEKEGENV